MELKRILANDIKSATDLAIKQFGRDVLVISSQTVGGQAELVVALDIAEQVPSSDEQNTAEQVDRTGTTTNFMSHLVRDRAQSSAFLEEIVSTPLRGDLNSVMEQEKFLKNREIMDLIRDEMAALRRELSLSDKTSGWQSNLQLSHEVNELLSSFTLAGMPTGLRTLLLDTVKDMRSEQEALRAIRQQLEQVAQHPGLALPQSGTHMIVGPSGVGKTMMAVRLASHAVAKNSKSKVALISYCDNRADSWRHTQALASQAGVECFRVDGHSSLSALLRTLGGYDLLLIDTVLAQLPERIAEIKSICPSLMLHALVAADSSTATLRRTLGASIIRWNSLMVSKLDESVAPWPLIEFLCDNFLSLSVASEGTQIGALKLDLTISVLIEKAMATLFQAPEPQSQIRKTRLPSPSVAMLPALVVPQFLKPASLSPEIARIF